LRYGLVGAWSRRITEEHRLVYRIVGDDLQILESDTTTPRGLLAPAHERNHTA